MCHPDDNMYAGFKNPLNITYHTSLFIIGIVISIDLDNNRPDNNIAPTIPMYRFTYEGSRTFQFPIKPDNLYYEIFLPCSVFTGVKGNTLVSYKCHTDCDSM